ncbi:DUF5719 family protein [Brachybacterium sp. AOP25-B2-12]|uniref:DUF5719 family protein n=1 Tax=Brachybacterium sp. AOP25-B2-12 TaxID=3457710 RepID=UPI0040340F3D
MTARVRGILAVLSLLPVAGAATAVALVPAPGATIAERGTAEATPVASGVICPGPLTIPEELLETGGDSALALVPPNPAVSLRSVALQGDSALLFGRTAASSTAIAADGTPIVPTISATDPDGTALGAEPATGTLGDAVLTADGTRAAASVTVEGAEVVADTVQSSTTAQGDYRSLTLARCTTPAVSATFLGASTTTGASSALVLTNPGTRPATASIRAWGADGPVDLAGGSRVVVPPGTTQTVLLESLVPGESELGVQVDSTGAPLAMHLQTTAREGLTPQGAEILTPQPTAATDPVLPGVRVAAGRDAVALLLNPGSRDAVADLAVEGAAGPIAVAAQTGVEIPAGTLVAVPLTGTTPGDVTLRVSADTELITAVRSSVAGQDLPGDTVGAPVDTAIAVPAAPLTDGSLLALPGEGPTGALALTADSDTGVTVIPVGADGSAGTPVRIELTADRTATVDSSGLTAASGRPAALTIVPDDPGVVRGAWIQQPADADGSGPLLATLPVPGSGDDGSALSVRAG